MTWSCDSNPAQYERNRRFGHLVHVLSRSADGAKLPSVGIYLNASKVETSLDMATLMLDWRSVWGTIGFWPPPRCRVLDLCLKYTCLSWRSNYRSSGPKSFVDDLCTGQGVVLGRAATTLRSIETFHKQSIVLNFLKLRNKFTCTVNQVLCTGKPRFYRNHICYVYIQAYSYLQDLTLHCT